MTDANPRPRNRPAGAAFVVTAGAIVLFVLPLMLREQTPPAEHSYEWVVFFGTWVLSLLYWHGYRVIGLMPPTVTALAVCHGYGTFSGDQPGLLSYFSWAAIGVVIGTEVRFLNRGVFNSATRHTVHDSVPRIDAVIGTALGVTFIVGLVVARFIPAGEAAPYLRWLALGWLPLLVFAWVRLFREFFELCVEPFVWFGYRVRGHGPGLAAIPYSGPLVVVANHACWWDPLFLAKLLPRPVTPMMTSVFFDIWFLRPLMTYVFRTIRVPDGAVRRTTPEIAEAIRAIDQGKCIVIFPEGYLRRRDDLPLRRFGRGVWEILRARPNTPVVCCWIEGNWGSWASFAGGPPTKNKSPDFRRRIDVGMSAPATVPAELLVDHLTTRIALMNEVNDARKHVGLLPFPPFARPEAGADTESSE